MIKDEVKNLLPILFDEFIDPLIIVDIEDWSLVEANKSAMELFGLSKDKLGSFTLPQFKRIFKLLRKENTKNILSELVLDTVDNREVFVDIFAQILESGGKQYIVAICRSVTDQYQMNDKLIQTDKLVILGQLSASLVHEIRNPLAAVNLNLQLLQRNLDNNSSCASYIQTALQGVERISKIIDVTLNFSRVSKPQIEKIQINSIILMTLELINHLFKKRDIELAFDFQNELGLFEADPKQVQQILINLITNAIDAIEGKGKIIIKTFEESGKSGKKFICTSITDNGVGISKEDISKIFNPFFTKKPNGTGLGLPITQRLLIQYKGEIEVESELNKGTTFTIKFPSCD